MSSSPISVVIPNWNGEKLIVPCLKSLADQSFRVDIIVVDNGSTDNSVTTIKQHFPNVTVLELPKNLGFAGGVNAGIKAAMEQGAKFVALFNNDAIADKKWAEKLVEAAEQQTEAGIVTGKLLQLYGHKIDTTGELFYSWGVSSPRGRDDVDKGQYDKPGYMFGATGGASLYRVKMFQHIGLFDEDFFMYYEDIDVSFRAQLAGWKVYYEPEAVAFHHMNASTKKVPGLHAYQTMKNLPLLFWKNVPGSLLPFYLPKFSVMYLITFVGMTRRGGGWPATKGVFMAAWLLPKKIVQRQAIQHRRVATVSYIRSTVTTGLPPGVAKLGKLLSFFHPSRGTDAL